MFTIGKEKVNDNKDNSQKEECKPEHQTFESIILSEYQNYWVNTYCYVY